MKYFKSLDNKNKTQQLYLIQLLFQQAYEILLPALEPPHCHNYLSYDLYVSKYVKEYPVQHILPHGQQKNL